MDRLTKYEREVCGKGRQLGRLVENWLANSEKDKKKRKLYRWSSWIETSKTAVREG